MSHAGLETLNFAAYGPLFREVLAPGSVCALSDAEGTIVHAEDAFRRPLAAKVLEAVTRNRQSPMTGSPRTLRIRLADQALLATPLCSEEGEVAAYLWSSAPRTADTAFTTRRLSAVAAILAQHLRLNAELDELATELASRYEELNLVYHTEDKVANFADGQQALGQLVRNCCDYLNVRLATLIMRDKGVLIEHASGTEKSAAPTLTPDALRTAVYDRIVTDKETLVVNDPQSSGLANVCEGHTCRVLATPLLNSNGDVSGILAIINDADRPKFSNSDKNLLQVMARKAAKIVQVSYDPLTGLVNREGFEFFAGQLFLEVEQGTLAHAVLHIDIDQLRLVNDTVSYDAGDAVIRAVGNLLRNAVRDSDVVARLGADEFGVLLRRCPLKRASDIADKLRESIVDLVIPWTTRSLTVTVSIGVAPIDDRTESAAAALAAAELACEAAKELGTNRVHCYQHSDTGLIKRHHEMETVGRIQDALHHNRFALYAQPIEALGAARAGLHLEVLLRMRGEDDKPLSPALFLPAAERYHLMADIDRWVVSNTVAFLNANAAQVASRIELLAVNLSGQSLSEPGFLTFLEDQLSGLAVPLSCICFEITETAAVKDLERARAFMTELKRRGCVFALDDFGAGLSSFAYLRSLPVDYLKIDGSIVKSIAEDPIAASMVAAVQQVASVMKLETVAEFVENDAIRSMLAQMGVTYAQGYAIGKPQPLAAFLPVPSRLGLTARQ